METLQTITIKLRLRDRHSSELRRQARAVNVVWNYCNETQIKAVSYRRRWPNYYDFHALTSGAGTLLDISAQTVCKVCAQYDASRRRSKRAKLRFRGKKSLGWVPFNAQSIKFDGQAFVFRKIKYETMHNRPDLLSEAKIRDGSFNSDSRGRWYINITIQVACAQVGDVTAVGIDLGLKSLATMSDGETISMPSFYRRSEKLLADAQRAGKTRQISKICAHIVNQRRDFLHKASADAVKKYGVIIVGDVSPSKLARTRMAKSIHDAAWSGFKSMLSYKSIMNGGKFVEVNEAYTSQTCSTCGCLPLSRPRGIAGLSIREWTCDDCGSVNDRDVNAARNILRIGLDTLAEGTAQMRSGQQEKNNAE